MFPQSRTLIWHNLLQREQQTAENKRNSTHPYSVTFLSSARTTSSRKISTAINHHHSPLFAKSWMILVHLSQFKEFWHVVLLWMLKFFSLWLFPSTTRPHCRKVAQKSDNINCQGAEEARCPCSLKMKTFKEFDLDWRSFPGGLEK